MFYLDIQEQEDLVSSVQFYLILIRQIKWAPALLKYGYSTMTTQFDSKI